MHMNFSIATQDNRDHQALYNPQSIVCHIYNTNMQYLVLLAGLLAGTIASPIEPGTTVADVDVNNDNNITSENLAIRAVTQPYCETSDNSPNAYDGINGASYFAGLFQNCCQTRNSGSPCTTMYRKGNAEFELCGPYNSCVPCNRLSAYFANLAQTCMRDFGGVAKSGGQQVLNENTMMKVQLTRVGG